MLWVLNHGKDLIDGADSDLPHLSLEVSLLEGLNRAQQGNGSIVEVGFSIKLRVGQEVDESSLLDCFVLLVDTVVLELLLGMSQMLILSHLSFISPLVGQLSILVVGVSVVEDREFGTDEIREVTNLKVTNVVSNQELVMPDHSSQPIIVFPTAKSTDCVD